MLGNRLLHQPFTEAARERELVTCGTIFRREMRRRMLVRKTGVAIRTADPIVTGGRCVAIATKRKRLALQGTYECRVRSGLMMERSFPLARDLGMAARAVLRRRTLIGKGWLL